MASPALQNTGKCQAKVEYLAALEDIQKFLSEGYSRRAIFKHYTDKGTFTMKYNTFCKYVRKSRLHKEIPKKNEAKLNNAKPIDAGPRVIESDSDSFATQNKYDATELFGD